MLGELTRPSAALYATWLTVTEPDVLVPLLQRLNERRDRVRAARPASLFICCPADSAGTVRDTAPDLWSVRTLTVTVDRPAVVDRVVAPVEPMPAALIVARGPGVSPTAAVDGLVRRAAGAVGARRVGEALAAARELVAVAGEPGDVALAHAWLARAMDLAEEPLEAQRHARLALRPDVPLGSELTDEMLGLLADAEDPGVALPAAEAVVGQRRADVQARPDSPDALRDLSYALNRLTNLHHDRGQLDDALTTATESVDLSRRLRTTLGDTPQTLRDLTIALTRLTNLRRDRWQLDDALTTATESLDLSRRLRTTLGDTPQTLRDLSVALDRTGRIRAAPHDTVRAREDLAESLELDRTIRTSFGDSPRSLQDNRVSAAEVARLEEQLGHRAEALALYREALDADHALRDRFGPPFWTGSEADLLASIERLSVEDPP